VLRDGNADAFLVLWSVTNQKKRTLLGSPTSCRVDVKLSCGVTQPQAAFSTRCSRFCAISRDVICSIKPFFFTSPFIANN
jgi:hypothetical protein